VIHNPVENLGKSSVVDDESGSVVGGAAAATVDVGIRTKATAWPRSTRNRDFCTIALSVAVVASSRDRERHLGKSGWSLWSIGMIDRTSEEARAKPATSTGPLCGAWSSFSERGR
jgi:hypothetical protein